MIEFILRSKGRDTFENLMKQEGWMLPDGTLHRDAMCDPAPGSAEYNTGIPIIEASQDAPGDKPPYYSNVRITGVLEASQIAGLPQVDAAGKPLPAYQRTKLGQTVYRQGIPWNAANGTTKGVEHGNVVYIYSDSVKSRKRVWQ